MKPNLYSLIIFILIGSSCIRQYPEPQESVHEIVLCADMSAMLAYKKVIMYDSDDVLTVDMTGESAYAVSVSPGLGLRFVAEIFSGDGKLVDRRVMPAVVDPENMTATSRYDILLPHDDYVVVSWMDYVADKDCDDLYYDTSEGLMSLWLSDENIPLHRADLDAMAGRLEFRPNSENNRSIVTLHRIQGSYRLLFTDINAYNMVGRSDSHMTAVVTYSGFPNIGFNLLEMEPISWTQTYSFETELIPDDVDSFVIVDYPFVAPGRETILKMDITIYQDGEIINSIKNLSVPLYPAHETVIEGAFLTNDYHGDGDVGIDESFRDEEVIYYPIY